MSYWQLSFYPFLCCSDFLASASVCIPLSENGNLLVRSALWDDILSSLRSFTAVVAFVHRLRVVLFMLFYVHHPARYLDRTDSCEAVSPRCQLSALLGLLGVYACVGRAIECGIHCFASGRGSLDRRGGLNRLGTLASD